jgi:ribonuclease P protein component
VTRNRVRRQLREILRAREEHLRAGAAYLVGVTPAAPKASFEELARAMDGCLAMTHV